MNRFITPFMRLSGGEQGQLLCWFKMALDTQKETADLSRWLGHGDGVRVPERLKA